MCGICGIITTGPAYPIRERIAGMCAALAHRGPDDQGMHFSSGEPAVGLGHRRLKIIDLSPAAHQPMANEDGSLRLVFNGEIYNFQALREELQVRGHVFRSRTDAEVVLHLYEELGERCLSRLRGMFAFALWDDDDKQLFVARDRLGQKPLWFHSAPSHFCFASELSALLESGLVEKKIDPDSIDMYLTLGYIPAPASIFHGVRKLLPAHYGILKGGTFRLNRYWDLSYSPKFSLTESEAAEELVHRLEEAVSLRLVSDVPLGVFLSGGLDSSLVTALMSRKLGQVKTFSIGFDRKDFDELPYARQVARHYSTDHNEFRIEPKALEVLPRLVERYGEPYADASAIPTYYVSKLTRNHVTVALNGDGGDESFAGYDRYQAMGWAERISALPEWLRKALKTALSLSVPDSVRFKSRRRRFRRFIEHAGLPFGERYLNWIAMTPPAEKLALYSPDFLEKLRPFEAVEWMYGQSENRTGEDLVDRLLATDVQTYLPNDLLVKVDIASMANALETRSPFLDHELVEFAARLPADFKLRNGIKKFILKKAAGDLLPRSILTRKKMGFGVPVGDWFRGELKDFLRQTLLSKTAAERGYFRPHQVDELISRHTSHHKDNSHALWSLLMLELWHQRFIDP